MKPASAMSLLISGWNSTIFSKIALEKNNISGCNIQYMGLPNHAEIDVDPPGHKLLHTVKKYDSIWNFLPSSILMREK